MNTFFGFAVIFSFHGDFAHYSGFAATFTDFNNQIKLPLPSARLASHFHNSASMNRTNIIIMQTLASPKIHGFEKPISITYVNSSQKPQFYPNPARRSKNPPDYGKPKGAEQFYEIYPSFSIIWGFN